MTSPSRPEPPATTSVAPRSPDLPFDPMRAAVADVAAAASGVVPFGVVLGLTVLTTDTAPLAGLVGAAVVYGGSAQLTTTTVLHLGGGLLAAVAAGASVNSRVMLYGAALEPRFRGQPLWFRLLGPAYILDQTYLAAVSRPDHGPRHFRAYWGRLGTVLLVVWLAAVALGMVAGPALTSLPHLVLVGTALFVAMLAPRLVTRPAVVAAAVASAAALLTAQVAPGLAIVVGSCVGVAAALRVDRRAEK